MISDRALDRAVAEAVVTAEQARRLRVIERALAPEIPQESADDESLRFVTGFADLFVTIGLVLFLGALAFMMDAGSGSTPMYAGLAASSWLLAEFFTLKRRMALPSLVLLVVFVWTIFVLSAQIFAALLPGHAGTSVPVGLLPTARDYLPLGLAAAVTATLAAIHYIRFRVPITIAAGTAALCILALAIAVGVMPKVGETALNIVLFVCGLAVFALAMRFDMSDPQRATRRTDIAFWLHLLAAPLIVHPLISIFLHGVDSRLDVRAAIGVIWIFLALGVVAVIIDRRAMLVSGLVYAGIAIATVVRSLGLEHQVYPLAAAALALGAFILLLSAGWAPLRRALLKRLPPRLAGRLPHPLVTSHA